MRVIKSILSTTATLLLLSVSLFSQDETNHFIADKKPQSQITNKKPRLHLDIKLTWGWGALFAGEQRNFINLSLSPSPTNYPSIHLGGEVGIYSHIGLGAIGGAEFLAEVKAEKPDYSSLNVYSYKIAYLLMSYKFSIFKHQKHALSLNLNLGANHTWLKFAQGVIDVGSSVQFNRDEATGFGFTGEIELNYTIGLLSIGIATRVHYLAPKFPDATKNIDGWLINFPIKIGVKI